MKWVRDNSGRFRQRPHYLPNELEEICEDAIFTFLRERHGKVSFPDLRIEYANQEMETSRVDLELATGHYHAGHLAEKASAARGPTVVMVPLRGVSAIDQEGQPFWWPEADTALFDAIRKHVPPHVRLIEVDAHVNDAAFAETATGALLAMVKRRSSN